MDVIYITSSPTLQIPETGFDLNIIKSLSDIQEKVIIKSSAIFVDVDSVDLHNILKKIKMSKDIFLLPLLSNKKSLHPIFDACFIENSFQENENLINRINKRIKLLKYKTSGWRHKLLMHLFTREHCLLTPIKNWKKKQVYYYPIIEAFNPGDSYFLWLDDIVNQRILDKKSLISQSFMCPSCQSSHLHFEEKCPNCASLDIHSESFIHCFSCGHMDIQKKFLYRDRLRCPNCRNNLRHIGQDYDRPLETGICSQCDEPFIDTSLEVTCLLCNKNLQTDELYKRAYYEYSLSQAGFKYIENYEEDRSLEIFNEINYVNNNYFYSFLNWLLLLDKRHKDPFGLVFFNFDKCKHENIIHNIAEALRKLLRTTDILTKINEKYIWIILPKLNKETIEIIKDRFTKLIEHQKISDGQAVSAGYFLSEDLHTEEEPKMLLARLLT